MNIKKVNSTTTYPGKIYLCAVYIFSCIHGIFITPSDSSKRRFYELLTNSRNGICMIKHELHQKDMIVSPPIEQGQSPYQISVNLPKLGLSIRTIYTNIGKGLFSVRNVYLKRKPKFKPRKCHKKQITDGCVFVNRTYLDFQSMGLEYFLEMDTVHSSRESKRLC